MVNPIICFNEWYQEELLQSNLQIPSAVCLSTIGIDNFPNARFVSLKEVRDNRFIITGPLNSRKGIEIKNNTKVALTFWWTSTERQVRIQGMATPISEDLADAYFKERSVASKVVSSMCSQGQEVTDLEFLEEKVLTKVSEDTEIKRPKNWRGFAISPVRIELMQFKTSRFHHRILYELVNEKWQSHYIQP
ncbi:pyridoxine/pyridoxamine 5'-phosphate oxidase [Winogradskyella flava]|uniref:Pyridoxal 5'-phosphate synthase n=1 Tax=Winogradskyella flava TaxID=1884876 RepID=A0A842IQW7_9FLAO|nr:pyridoxal 5'-phosphate synthase [Winogradskyella flava]MBC2845115.1 pyridoxal 5'-phosphate synthase [Winogradskyella flava]